MKAIVRFVALALLSFGAISADSGRADSPDRMTANTTEAAAVRVLRATLWRVDLFESNGQSAGGFENEDYDRCLRYAKNWNEGGAGRRYVGPFKVPN